MNTVVKQDKISGANKKKDKFLALLSVDTDWLRTISGR
jgi:hypothetical protein